jgi:proteic killer suppression protein
MDFSFASKKLAWQLTDATAMSKAYGSRADKEQRRLDLLAQSPCLADVPVVPPTRRHALTGDRAGQFAVAIEKNWRLIFVANHDPIPRLPDGGIDLAKVTAVKFLEVADYHGN